VVQLLVALFGSAAASLMGGDLTDIANATISGSISALTASGIGKLMLNISKSGIQAAIRAGILTGFIDAMSLSAKPVFACETASAVK